MGSSGKPDASVFGRRVREERLRKGWRLEDLREAVALLGITRHITAYSKLEAGEREPKIGEAVAVSAALGVPLGALFIDDSELEAAVSALQARASDALRESTEALSRAARLSNEAQRLAAGVTD